MRCTPFNREEGYVSCGRPQDLLWAPCEPAVLLNAERAVPPARGLGLCSLPARRPHASSLALAGFPRRSAAAPPLLLRGGAAAPISASLRPRARPGPCLLDKSQDPRPSNGQRAKGPKDRGVCTHNLFLNP